MQQLLAVTVSLNFTLDPKDFVGANKKSDFYEIWQQHKQLKTMEMSKAWPETYDEGYINQFQLEPTHKID